MRSAPALSQGLAGPFPSAMGEMRVQTSCAVLPRRWRALASAPTFASAGSTAPSDSMSSATDMRRCTWSTCSVTRPSVSPKRSARLAASCRTWDLSQDARGLPHNFASRWVPIFCRTTEGPILLSSLVLALLFFFSFLGCCAPESLKPSGMHFLAGSSFKKGKPGVGVLAQPAHLKMG